MKKIETSFEESRQFAQKLNLKSKDQWFNWHKENKPKDIPASVSLVYKNRGWISWGDFLGTGREADQYKTQHYLSYKDAKVYLSTLNFKSEEEFLNWCKTDKKPIFIPHKARRYYANRGWISMGDFLSNGNTHAKEWLPYEDAQKFVQSQNLCSQREYQSWCKSDKRPLNIPTHPTETYIKEWTCWGDFLGYKPKTSHGEKIISFFLQSNNIDYKRQYTFKDCRMTNPLPFDVAIFVNDKLVACIEYQGVQHYLSVPYYGGDKALKENQIKDRIKREYCESNNIQLLIISYQQHDKIEDLTQQFLSTILNKSNLNIFGRELIEFNPDWLSFEDAKKSIKYLNLTQKQFVKLGVNGRPNGMPSFPPQAYKDKGWISWGDFLGTGRIQSAKARDVFVSFEECQQWMKNNNILSGEHWKIICKQKPNFIPSHPDKIYKTQWSGWRAFLNK